MATSVWLACKRNEDMLRELPKKEKEKNNSTYAIFLNVKPTEFNTSIECKETDFPND
jgi:hypothetical protein